MIHKRKTDITIKKLTFNEKMAKIVLAHVHLLPVLSIHGICQCNEIKWIDKKFHKKYYALSIIVFIEHFNID